MNTIRFFTDGGCRKNPGPAASAVYFPDMGTGLGMFIGQARTNNEAEAEAFVMGLKHAAAIGADSLKIHSDSQLLVHLVNGWWKPSAPTMQAMLEKICDVLYGFGQFEIDWVPRDQNKEADWICNQVLDKAEQGEYLECPTQFVIPSSVSSSTPTK